MIIIKKNVYRLKTINLLLLFFFGIAYIKLSYDHRFERCEMKIYDSKEEIKRFKMVILSL